MFDKVKVINKIYLYGVLYKTNLKIDKNKLLNFDIVAKNKDKELNILVLDNYGIVDMTSMPSEYIREFFNRDIFTFTIAINKITGKFYILGVVDKNTLALEEIDLEVPKAYLKRIDELKCQKRPFGITCSSNSLWDFIIREIGNRDLAKSIVIELYFRKVTVEITRFVKETISWREVPRWN